MNKESQGTSYFFNAKNSQDLRQNIQYFTQYFPLINTVLFNAQVVICNNFTEYHDTDALFNCPTITYNAAFVIFN